MMLHLVLFPLMFTYMVVGLMPDEYFRQKIEIITETRDSLSEPVDAAMPFLDQYEAIWNSVKTLSLIGMDAIGARNSDDVTKMLKDLPERITTEYQALVENVRKFEESNTKEALKDATFKLAEYCISVINISRDVRVKPNDLNSWRLMHDHAKTISEVANSIRQVLIQSGSGIQACIETIGTIARITENVETMQMLARDGTLEGTGDPFSNHREDMSGAAKRLVGAARLLVNGAISSNQEQVKDAAMTAEKTISDLANAVESGVISLSIDDVVTRSLLLNAGTDVAKALSNILEFTKNAFGKSPNDASWDKLYSSVKELVNIVRSFLETVESV